VKFYVQSGDVKVAIDRPSPAEAAKSAIMIARKKRKQLNLGFITLINEHGFIDEGNDPEDIRGEDWVWLTQDILEELRILGEFDMPDIEEIMETMEEDDDDDSWINELNGEDEFGLNLEDDED
jgi:hypothetical protein